MTTDQLRTGAALVRALVEGDETARGPLSDFLLQHEQISEENVEVLRQPWAVLSVIRFFGERLVCVHRNAKPITPPCFNLGWFPTWAWNGTDREATHADQ